MNRYLLLRLDAPLLAFGGEAIDNYGVIRPFPAKSMITGMLANALGIERNEAPKLQALQDSLVVGSRVTGRLSSTRDFQTAKISKNDQGWTTRARVEGRGSSAASYTGPHLRYRDYWPDAGATVVLGLNDSRSSEVAAIKKALEYPARPLFLGRKCCIPSGFILNEEVTALSLFHALIMDWEANNRQLSRLQWPAPETGEEPSRFLEAFRYFRLEPICDERNWITGVHAGHRLVHMLEAGPKVQ